MREGQKVDSRPRAAPDKEGIAFALVMALAAYLGRADENFVYPQVFWSFFAFLVFGLVSISFLSKRLERRRWSVLYTAGNAFLISVIVLYSGGDQSYFWVMYLLPIFSAALSFERRGVLAVTASVCAVLAAFYAPALRDLAWSEIFEMVVKVSTLIAAASVTARAAQGERRARGLLDEERESAARERLALQEKLQHMDRLSTLGTLTASITHELNGPIAVILGYAEVVDTGMVDASKMGFCVERIKTSALRCKRVIEDMLAYSRGQKSEKKPADVNALVHKCVDLRRYEWLSTGVEVAESFDPLLPKVALSSSEFQQVVFNLLSNAVQAIRSKSEPKGRIRVRTEARGRSVRIVIEDDGPGIPPEILPKIWEPFFTTKPPGEGTGLGLSICRRIVEDHQGMLSVDSEMGRRTAFTIEFQVPADVAGNKAP